jgi:hypothetical protein
MRAAAAAGSGLAKSYPTHGAMTRLLPCPLPAAAPPCGPRPAGSWRERPPPTPPPCAAGSGPSAGCGSTAKAQATASHSLRPSPAALLAALAARVSPPPLLREVRFAGLATHVHPSTVRRRPARAPTPVPALTFCLAKTIAGTNVQPCARSISRQLTGKTSELATDTGGSASPRASPQFLYDGRRIRIRAAPWWRPRDARDRNGRGRARGRREPPRTCAWGRACRAMPRSIAVLRERGRAG